MVEMVILVEKVIIVVVVSVVALVIIVTKVIMVKMVMVVAMDVMVVKVTIIMVVMAVRVVMVNNHWLSWSSEQTGQRQLTFDFAGNLCRAAFTSLAILLFRARRA